MLTPTLADELAALHDLQREAAMHSGNVAVLAGPGAGKTRTLVARVAYLLELTSAYRGVAAITYADAAAREVTGRLHRLGLRPGRRLASRTVHSFCLHHILMPYGEIAGHPLAAGFQVLDDVDALWGDAFKAVGYRYKKLGSEVPIATTIRRRLAAGEDVSGLSEPHRNAVLAYERMLRERRLLDFDAMTSGALTILRESAAARDLLMARFPHLVIDEYQDLGPVLHGIVTLLMDAGMNVTAVGDPDQTMYEFQGADPRYLNELAQRDGVTPIRLKLNYRSGSALVAASRAALGADRGYTHDPDRTDPGVIDIRPVDGDLDAHAARTVEVVQKMFSQGVAAEDIAVLYSGPVNPQAQIEASFVAAGIAFDAERSRSIPSGSIADLVSACAARRLSGPLPGFDPRSAGASRATRRRPGRAPLGAMELAAELNRMRVEAGHSYEDRAVRALARTLIEVLDAPGREVPKDGATAFLHALREAIDLPTLAASRNDQRDRRAPAALDAACAGGLTMAELAGGGAPGRVVLTTYHSAKGREFPVVILPGLVECLVPFYFANQGITEHALSDARRKFYVAVSRASDAVVLIPGPKFTAWDKQHRTGWSRFVVDIQRETSQ